MLIFFLVDGFIDVFFLFKLVKKYFDILGLLVSVVLCVY